MQKTSLLKYPKAKLTSNQHSYLVRVRIW